MKKLLVLGAFALFGAMNAQETSEGFAKGSTFVTGAVGFGSSSYDEAKTSGFTFSPSVGHFVSENIAVGARLGFSNLTEDDGEDKIKSNEFSAGLFGRYYWMPASKFSIFAELGVDYMNTSEDSGVSGAEKFKTNGFGFAFAPGINYFLNNHFALEAKWGVLGFNSVKADVEGAKATNNFNLGVNLSNINLGLVYKF